MPLRGDKDPMGSPTVMLSPYRKGNTRTSVGPSTHSPGRTAVGKR